MGVIITEMYSGSLLVYYSPHFLLCSAQPNSRSFVNEIMKDAWETGQIENDISVDLLIWLPYTFNHKMAPQRSCLSSCIDKAWRLYIYKSSKLHQKSVKLIVQSTVIARECCLPSLGSVFLSLIAKSWASLLSFHLQIVSRWTSASRMRPLPSPSSNSLTERAGSHQCFSSNSPPSLT